MESNMRKLTINCVTLSLPLMLCCAQLTMADTIEEEVAKTERAFAKTMAERNLQEFQSYIAPDAVFWNGTEELRGKDNVVAAWKAYFEGPDAPFAWKPETVMVLEAGTLALSSGPVSNPDNVIDSYFTSVWRKNDEGNWKIIFDKGQKYCAP